MPEVNLELKTPGDLLDEIMRLRTALQEIADLPPVNMATRPIQKQVRDIAIKALRRPQ